MGTPLTNAALKRELRRYFWIQTAAFAVMLLVAAPYLFGGSNG